MSENEVEKTEAPKKQPLSLEEMIARREAEKKAQEKVDRKIFLFYLCS